MGVEDPDRDDGVQWITVHADGGGLASRGERVRELPRTRAGDREVGGAGVQRLGLAHEPDQLPDADPERHQRRRRSTPRAWTESSTPIASRFATIEEPPTVTNGSGMPVTGAI